MSADRRHMKLKCAVCGQIYKYSDNIGTLQCSLTITGVSKETVKIRICHIDGTYDAQGSLPWSEALHRLGKFASIPSFALDRLTTPMAPDAAVPDIDAHNKYLLSHLNPETQLEAYSQLKIPETDSRELVSLIYYYQFDWRKALPIILQTTYADVIQSSQPWQRQAYFIKRPIIEETRVYDTHWYKHRLTQEEQRRVIQRLR